MEVSGQVHVPVALTRGNSPRHSMNRKFGGSQSRSGRYGEKKNLTPAGNRTPAVQPIAIPTGLSRLLCRHYTIIIITTTIIIIIIINIALVDSFCDETG
jgi:hypothetical protein